MSGRIDRLPEHPCTSCVVFSAMDKRRFILARVGRILWLKAAIFCLVAVAAALVAHWAGPFLPSHWAEIVGENAIRDILSMLASSMLAVATFSLATMVAAIGSVTTNTSPRAAALLLEDRSAQNALSIFIGAFIFSIVGLIALSTEFYSPAERFVLFIETLVVIALVVLRLLKWIDQLSQLGKVSAVIDRVEEATWQALRERLPHLGGTPAGVEEGRGAAVMSEVVGYVRHIDVERLHKRAETSGCRIHLQALPGDFIAPSHALARVPGSDQLSEEEAAALRSCFTIGDTRTFEQDPEFGLVVLAEIASRALSSAINDPGTAIDVIGTATRLLTRWSDTNRKGGGDSAPFHRVHVPPIPADKLFDDIFRPIARDGAALVEVGIALQKALLQLAWGRDPEFSKAAREHSTTAMRRAETALSFEPDYLQLKALAEAVAAPDAQ
jgi:uncharacterized membrane protein